MDEVIVIMTATFRCRDARGRFYSERPQVRVQTQRSNSTDDYVTAAFNQGLVSVPDNCTGVSWNIDSVTDVQGADSGEPGQLVTVHMLVWGVDEANDMVDHEYTQQFDTMTTADLQDVIAQAESMAYEFFIQKLLKYPVDATWYDWRITSPAYFQYHRG